MPAKKKPTTKPAPKKSAASKNLVAEARHLFDGQAHLRNVVEKLLLAAEADSGAPVTDQAEPAPPESQPEPAPAS